MEPMCKAHRATKTCRPQSAMSRSQSFCLAIEAVGEMPEATIRKFFKSISVGDVIIWTYLDAETPTLTHQRLGKYRSGGRHCCVISNQHRWKAVADDAWSSWSEITDDKGCLVQEQFSLPLDPSMIHTYAITQLTSDSQEKWLGDV